MAIKKNAAKADIGPKKQVKATFAECTAEDPLKCRYHGPKMLQAELDKLMGKGAAKVKKTKNGYEITSDDAYDAYNKVAALLPNAKGSLGFKKAIFILGDEGFVTPEGEAELEDADTLSSSDAPKNNTAANQKNTGEDTDALIEENELDADLLDNFDELDDVVGEVTEDLEAELLGNTDFDDDVFADETEEDQLPKDLTDEQIKDLVSFKGITDDHFEQNPGLMDSYKSIILNGLNPSWSPLNDNQKAWWNDLLDKAKDANEDELPALKVLKETMKKVNGEKGNSETQDLKQLTDEDVIEVFSTIYNSEAKAHGESDRLENNQRAIGFYKYVLENHKNPPDEIFGEKLADDQLKWFAKVSQKAHAAGVDNYALELLDKMLADKGVIKKVNGGGEQGGNSDKEDSQTPSEEDYEKFVGELIKDPFPPFIKTEAKLLKELVEKGTMNGTAPSKANIEEWENVYGRGKGTDGAVKDAVNAAFAKLKESFSTQNHEAEMEKCAAKWNNLMDTAINGKHLLGTQYWAETLQPIVDAYNDAVEANDVVHAYDAVYDLKNAVKDAPENGTPKPKTKDSLIAEMGNVIAKMKGEGLDLTWDAKKGNALGKAFEDAINAEDIEGAAKALDNFKEYVEFLESGGDAPEEDGLITDEDVQEFYDAVGVGTIVTPEQIKASKELCNNGTWDGSPPTAANKKWFKENAKKFSDLKFSKAVLEALKPKKKGKKQKSGAKDALLNALGVGNPMSKKFSSSEISKTKLKPLEHDESRFPIGVTKEVLDKALSDSSAKALGGASGDHATLIVIDGRKYVCKKGSGSHAEHIHNEVLADQAYRAGGVRAPDCQEYVFGNYTYKLAEFIEGKSLSSYMASATAAQQEELRKDLLAGFPMDVLLSNWDVIGTSRDNIIVDADGHGWRIDNGGSFDMAAMSNKKTMAWAVEEYITKPEQKHKPPLAAFENWDKEGGWMHRQWIDDFRTMRVDPKNKGLFDQYSTAEIFLSAANVDFANAVSGLPQGLKDALAKPLFEMRAMAHQAWCAKEAGYSTAHSMTWKDANGGTQVTPVDTMSAALDAIYEAHKDGCREWLQKKTGWGNLGWLSSSGNGTGYQKKVFPESAPPEPLPPPIGTDFTAPILTAIKSIHYHIKQGDYTPNQTSLKKAIELKPILEMLEAENVEKAKGLLDAIHKIEGAAKDGYKKQLSFDTPDGMFDVNGLSLKFDSVHEAIFKKHNSQKHDEWKKNMEAYLSRKKVWDENEEKKAKAAGAAPENSFGAYEDKLIEANIDTNGVPRGNGNPKCNHESKEAQKDTSFSMVSCKKKVRQYAMMGIPLEAMYFQNGDKIFYNGNTENGGHHVSGYETSEKDFFAAIDFYRQNPETFRTDMESYARHKGMMALVHMNIENSAVNAKDGTVFVMRGEHKEAWGKNGIGKPTGKSRIIDRYPIDSSTSAQINNTGIMGKVHIGWKLPVWRISDNFMISTNGVNSGKDGEYEICINPIQIPYPPMYFSDADANKGWEHCMGLYLNESQIKGAQET